MTLVVADRVKETTAVAGTGTATLLGAATGFQSFAAIGDGNTTYYCIAGQGTAEWEVGIGTYTASGTTLARSTVLASSNAGALVNFSAGTKDVFCTQPAEAQAGLTNLIVNPGFTVNQLGYVSAAALASGSYGHDQWKAGSGGGDYSFTQLKSNTQITIAANKTLIQVIEDANVQSASYVLSWTGTALARYAVNSATPSGSYAASPITITGQTPGLTMSVEFGNGASAGTLGAVQLKAGTAATAFESRDPERELELCRRYCQVLKYGFQGSAANTTAFGAGVVFDPPMYATPTISVAGTTFTLSDFYSSGYSLAVSGATPSVSACDATGGNLHLVGAWSPVLPTSGIMLHGSSTGTPANDGRIVLSARP